jgi:succinate dehydrogenase / fumarate reductase iron-sulfur subunit
MGTKRHFRIWRGDGSGGDLQDFEVEVNEGEVVLDVIHRLQATQTPDLAVRWNCKAGKCGSCSCEINGRPKLSCMTRMSTFEDDETITVTPLRTFPVIRDLVTDVSYNYEKARETPAFDPPKNLKPGEYRMQQVDVERSQEFRKCIECFLCQNVCHVVRDHEENKKAFSGPRYFIRAAELDMHPLDANADRKEYAQASMGIGYCNITKCCSEVCPEHIKITDNAIIPMKERVVDRRFDPLVRLGRKIFRRDQLEGGDGHDAGRGADGTRPVDAGHRVGGARPVDGSQRVDGGRRTDTSYGTDATGLPGVAANTSAGGAHAQLEGEVNQHRSAPLPQLPDVGPDGRLPLTELTFDRAAAPSPFGDDVTFPLPDDGITYHHPSRDRDRSPEDH